MARDYFLKFRNLKNIVLVFLVIFSLSTLYLALVPLQEPCHCSNGKDIEPNDNFENHPKNLAVAKGRKLHDSDNPEWGPHRLAIIVPFRDRFEELMEFVPHLHNFLNKQKARHKIYVINQVDILRFNRASLINIGFLESERECDYIAMHDVDLLPVNKNLSYAYPQTGPFHVAAPNLHPKYHYKTFVGGILLLTNEQYRLVNGMSNKYWGWGKEDDEFYVRMRDANLQVQRPQNLSTGTNNTFKHLHDRRKRPRDNRRYFDQKAKSRIRDVITGLNTIQYDVISKTDMLIKDSPVTVINVDLKCDLDFTPWCVQPETYEVIQAYLLAKRNGEIGKVPSQTNNNKDWRVPGSQMAEKPKYVFKEPLDLHNFFFKDEVR